MIFREVKPWFLSYRVAVPSCSLKHRTEISLGSLALLRSTGAALRYRRQKPIRVVLNSKEEIGWKALLQNNNLWQEELWPQLSTFICAANLNDAASAFRWLYTPPPQMLRFLNC